MGSLRARLRRIQDAQKNGQAPPPDKRESSEPPLGNPESGAPILEASPEGFAGWEAIGDGTLRQETTLPAPAFPETFPIALGLLCPDFLAFQSDKTPDAALPGNENPVPIMPKPEDLLFFDLETTGLSSGAGTVAFLGAFGRLIPQSKEPFGGALPQNQVPEDDFPRSEGPLGGFKLKITQYLLLDYPGEERFIQALLDEFGAFRGKPLLVSYNGKSFDAQILKTRCVMNGIAPPDLIQGDLLYPSRRIWRRILPSCSQGTVETSALGLDRSGDIPGSLAPDAWFSFLKRQETGPLLGICEHNRRDIYGMAAILGAIAAIALDPLEALDAFRGDLEGAALHWRSMTRRRGGLFGGALAALEEQGASLLQKAAARGHPRAMYRYALDLFREKRREEGRVLLYALTESEESGFQDLRLKAAAARTLGIDAERFRKELPEALAFTRRALAFAERAEANGGNLKALRENLLRRERRLLGKLAAQRKINL